MKTIVGIQFKNASRVYYFDPLDVKFELGDYAIVETVRGLELGKVIIKNREVSDEEFSFELKPIVRKANNRDIEIDKKHVEQAKKSFEIFKKYVSQLDLPMKPLYCEYTIDSSKVVFYYSAEDRVDFRELLKVLAPNFKCRLELRQIGPREAAAIVGGVGNCGRIICCKSCINNFDFVTMKMAKEQNMSLNISKISGLCGKLMCCIGFEADMYAEVKKYMPKIGTLVRTPKGTPAKVTAVDYVKKVITVLEDVDVPPVKYTASELGLIEETDPMVNTEERVTTYTETEVVETAGVVEEIGITEVSTTEQVVTESNENQDRKNNQDKVDPKKKKYLNRMNNAKKKKSN